MVSSSSEVSGNGVSRGASIVAIVASLTGISAIFVAARLFVRIKMMRSLGLDDYLIILAMVCAFVNLGISSAAAASGSGRHFDNLSVEEQQNTIKYTIAAFCPGILSFAIPKLAVVALLAKLLNSTRMHRIFLWVFSGVTTAVLFGCVIILYAQCTPARSQWDFSVKGECWSIWILINYAIFAGALSAFVDLYLAVYPACILLKLQMSAQKKIGLGIALGIGSVACIVAAYKCTRIPGLASKDFSYHTADLVVWTCVEGSTIIIASCIPILQPLVKVVMGKNAFSSARYVGGGYSGQTPRKRATRPSDITLSGDLGNFGKSYTRTKIGVSQNAETGSQERILQEEIPAESHRGQSAQAKIIRTDEITISSSPAEGTLSGQ